MDLERNLLAELMGQFAVCGPQVIERPELSQQEDTSQDQGWIVRVFNNDHNTWDEVIHILMLATHCTPDEAAIETWEIDKLGSSVVHHGREDECRQAGAIIATIGIHLEVVQE